MVTRRIPAFALSVSMLALSAGPALAAAPAPASAAGVTTSVGTATSRSVPLAVTVGDLTVQVGALDLLATNDEAVRAGGAFAAAGFTLLDVGGTTFGQAEVRSDGTTSLTIMEVSEVTPLGPVEAVAADLLAVANDAAGTASATLGALGATTQLLDQLEVAVSVVDAAANVSDTESTSDHTLLVGGIDVTLETLLGGVLDQLPLDQLVGLADELGLELPVSLDAAGELVAATEDLVAAVAAITTASQDVADAADALAAADAVDPLAGYDVAGLTSVLTTLDVDPTDPVAVLAAVTSAATSPAFVALSCDLGALVGVPALEAMIACVQAELDAYAAALAALGDEAAAVEAAVQSFVDAVNAAAAAATTMQSSAATLPDALAAIDGLVDDLLAFDLLHLDEVLVTQQATAVGDDLAGSSASASCGDTALTVLGQPAVDVLDCDAAAAEVLAVVETVTATLQAVLDIVGDVDAGDGLTVELFGEVAEAVTQATDGRVDASSTVEVLRLAVPDITVTPCDVADGLVCALGLDLTGPLADALAAIDGALDVAMTTVTDALVPVSGLLDTLGTVVDGPVDPSAVIADAITALLTVIDGLDLGDLGDAQSITVPGVEVVVDPTVTASHLVALQQAPAPDPDTEPDPGTEGDPGGAPLPNTGGGAALVAAIAIAGGVLLMRRRRED